MSSESLSSLQVGSDADLMVDPRWFPTDFESQSKKINFCATDYKVLTSQTFLDRRWRRESAHNRSASTSTLLREPTQQLPMLNFIWHTGFCCSTLVAKALDHPEHNLSLCEPQIMVDMADAKRAGVFAHDAMSACIPQLIFRLLARGFAPNSRITLKPAPAANCLLREATLCTSGQMLFLYSDCRSFLISIAKLGEEGRKYARRMFLVMLGDGNQLSQWPMDSVLLLSDFEIAALVWHMQIGQFLRNWPLLGTGRAFSLDCDAFLASPIQALSRLKEIFSINLDSDHLKKVAEGPLFKRNAKTGEAAFDTGRRREEHSRIQQQFGGDLDRIVEQSYALCRATPHSLPLPNPLLTIDKAYLP